MTGMCPVALPIERRLGKAGTPAAMPCIGDAIPPGDGPKGPIGAPAASGHGGGPAEASPCCGTPPQVRPGVPDLALLCVGSSSSGRSSTDGSFGSTFESSKTQPRAPASFR